MQAQGADLVLKQNCLQVFSGLSKDPRNGVEVEVLLALAETCDTGGKVRRATCGTLDSQTKCIASCRTYDEVA